MPIIYKENAEWSPKNAQKSMLHGNGLGQWLSKLGLMKHQKTTFLEDIHSIIKKYPKFQGAKGFECILYPGDVLYIPPKCWHFVKSLSKSCSLSFWFAAQSSMFLH